jgi:hypothetical protein
MYSKYLESFFSKLFPIIFIFVKILVFLLGILFVFYTLKILSFNHLGLVYQILMLISSTLVKLMPYLIKFSKIILQYLLIPSITFLSVPVLGYVAICFITPAWYWRKFLCIITICFFLLSLNSLVFNGYSIPNITQFNLAATADYLKEVLITSENIIVYIAGIYLFLLWLFPQPIWVFFSGTLLFCIGLIETAIPTNFIPYIAGVVELITLSAAFTYLFIFLHFLASFVNFITKPSLINKIHGLLKSKLSILKSF